MNLPIQVNEVSSSTDVRKFFLNGYFIIIKIKYLGQLRKNSGSRRYKVFRGL